MLLIWFCFPGNNRWLKLAGGCTMNKQEFEQLLGMMIRHADGISDLVFVAGMPLQVEVLGELETFVCDQYPPVLTSELIEKMAGVIIDNNPRLLKDMGERGSCDCGYTLRDSCRFRANIYFQNGSYSMVLRYLRPLIPSFEALRLPAVFNEVIKEKNGLIFVTGGTGHGKTTTIAAMLNEINRSRRIHILTLEDPIEFFFTPIKSTFSQRELGRDFFKFHDGTRAALRQAPKIIFIGEIRDRETMEIALSAGETGHLVFSTLHTTSAAASINRILGMFSKDEDSRIRERLAAAIRFVISLRLVPAVSGARLLMTELMGSNLRSREAILLGESENRHFDDIIEAGSVSGWHTFEQSLVKAFEKDLITGETALLNCNHKMKMVQRLDSLNKPRQSGSADSLMASLRMQEEEKRAKLRTYKT